MDDLQRGHMSHAGQQFGGEIKTGLDPRAQEEHSVRGGEPGECGVGSRSLEWSEQRSDSAQHWVCL